MVRDAGLASGQTRRRRARGNKGPDGAGELLRLVFGDEGVAVVDLDEPGVGEQLREPARLRRPW
jgi:hypothetical protein